MRSVRVNISVTVKMLLHFVFIKPKVVRVPMEINSKTYYKIPVKLNEWLRCE